MPGGGKGNGCRASASQNVQNDPYRRACGDVNNSTGTRDTPNGLTQEFEVIGAVFCVICFGVMLVYALWKNRRRDAQMVAQALATAAELELAISPTPVQDAHLARARGEDCAICMLPLVPADAADGAAPDGPRAPPLSQCDNGELPHLFHEACLATWIAASVASGRSKPSCPTCKTAFGRVAVRAEGGVARGSIVAVDVEEGADSAGGARGADEASSEAM